MLSLLRTPVRRLALTAAAVAAIASCDSPTEPRTPGKPVAAKLELTPQQGVLPLNLSRTATVEGDSIKSATLRWPDNTTEQLPTQAGVYSASRQWSSLDSGYVTLSVTNMRDSTAKDSVLLRPSDVGPTARLTLADSVVDVGDSVLVTLEGKDNLGNIKLKLTHPFGADSSNVTDSTGVLSRYVKPLGVQSGFVKGTVTDAHGNEARDSVQVRSRFQPPMINVSAAPVSDTVPIPATFSFTAKDKAGADSIVAVYSDGQAEKLLLNGTRDTSFSKQHVYTSPGTYNARFTVYNKGGLSATQELTVTRSAGQTPLPEVALTLENKQDTIPHVVQAHAAIKHPHTTDSTRIFWDRNGVSTFIGALPSTDTTVTRSHTYSTMGWHHITVTAYRGGVSASATDSVETKPFPPANVAASLVSIDDVVREDSAAKATFRFTSDRQLSYAHILADGVRIDSVPLTGRTQDVQASHVFAPRATHTLSAVAFDTSGVKSDTAKGDVYVDGKPIVSASIGPSAINYPDSATVTVTVNDEGATMCSAQAEGNTYTITGTTVRIPTKNPVAPLNDSKLSAIVTCTDSRNQAESDETGQVTVFRTIPVIIDVMTVDNNTPYDTAVTINGQRYQTNMGAVKAYLRPGSSNVRVPGLSRYSLWKGSEQLGEAHPSDTVVALPHTDSTRVQLGVLPSTLDELARTALLLQRGSDVTTTGGFASAADYQPNIPGIQIAIAEDSAAFSSSSPMSADMRALYNSFLTTFAEELQQYAPRKVFGVTAPKGAHSPMIELRTRNNIIFPMVVSNDIPPCAGTAPFAGCNIITSDGRYTDNTFDIPTVPRIAHVVFHALYFRNIFANQGQESPYVTELLTADNKPSEHAKRVAGILGWFSPGFPLVEPR